MQATNDECHCGKMYHGFHYASQKILECSGGEHLVSELDIVHGEFKALRQENKDLKARIRMLENAYQND